MEQKHHLHLIRPASVAVQVHPVTKQKSDQPLSFSSILELLVQTLETVKGEIKTETPE